ncbi:MAG TPA: hypothetical protein VFX57_04710 [Sulfuricurvum sp.]|nr:hypothetical protein [Sulfuricurvum sp.]
MQIRELSAGELTQGYALLSTLRLDLTSEEFESFIASHFPKDYRPIGAYTRGDLHIYAGVSIRENLELGRHLILDDFVVREGYETMAQEMIDFLNDYAKMHNCLCVLILGTHKGLKWEHLNGFRPKRDGFIKIL